MEGADASKGLALIWERWELAETHEVKGGAEQAGLKGRQACHGNLGIRSSRAGKQAASTPESKKESGKRSLSSARGDTAASTEEAEGAGGQRRGDGGWIGWRLKKTA